MSDRLLSCKKIFFVKHRIKVSQLGNNGKKQIAMIYVSNNNCAFSAVAHTPPPKEEEKGCVLEGVGPYHEFTKLNSLTGDISSTIHVCYRLNGTRVEESASRQRERVCI